jgi:SDR family mycofactocin-dependent oxidoreductase
MRRFDDKIVMVTGGARGQGRAHAVGFAREGAHVVVCDVLEDLPSVPYGLASAADLEETRRLVEAEGCECLALRCDVRSSEQIAAVVDRTLSHFGAIDVLVANAGIASIATVADMSDLTWQTMLDVNLTGVFRSIRAVIPHMTARMSGRIVATSSIVGRQGSANISHYVAAKWGVIGLVKSAALEVARRGITVNAVAPTSVGTSMIHNPAFEQLFLPGVADPTPEQFADAYTALNPIPIPWLDPAEVTKAVLFLASPEARYITGEVIPVAAGWNARHAS